VATQACDRLIEKIDHCMIATHEDAKHVVEEMVASKTNVRLTGGEVSEHVSRPDVSRAPGMYIIIGWCELR
jgi:hypothetical protein